MVCSGRDATALAAAKGLAGQLGVPHRSVDGLEPLPAGPACADVAGADARPRATGRLWTPSPTCTAARPCSW